MLSPDAEVYAAYTDLEEAHIKMKEGVGLVSQADFNNERVAARETYYVRVVDGLQNPMADAFLKGRVFGNIESRIARST